MTAPKRNGMIKLEPCIFCGAEPEVKPDLIGATGSGGYTYCPTVHSDLAGTTMGCPAYADSVDAWNALMRMPQRRRKE